MTNVYTLAEPDCIEALPLVLDSPHSGSLFPDDFRCLASEAQLKSGWDAYVDDLWAPVLAVGGSLLSAHYSRMYIDLNRAPDDVDPAMLKRPWAGCNPSKYSERGMGLIRRYALPDVPMYDAPLNIEDIVRRIEQFHRPYHQALQTKLDTLQQQFSAVWHVDCHSMKSTGNRMNIDSGAARPDVVLGDNDGLCSDPGFVQIVEDAFVSLGYKVVRNQPYKGGYLVTHYGNPAKRRFSMQIELNRALYMDEQAFVPNRKFDDFRRDLGRVAGAMADYIVDNLGGQDNV
ncbi:N-formylglutamate amidohydrolase [Bowmanella denitrificans]|uniref:N-formylglutamate amidohydrolase n=1 Tax=Bowmanella denitrificans TaxID=366582 RepID=UPI000C9AA98E|nr:N-formylglutamate amidohydrolase [Bowmanella denitrificans]